MKYEHRIFKPKLDCHKGKVEDSCSTIINFLVFPGLINIGSHIKINWKGRTTTENMDKVKN